MADKIHPLKRYYRAVHRLRDDLKRSIYMEMYKGLGDTAVRTYRGIHEAVMRETDDVFVSSLVMEDPAPDMGEKQKVAMVNLLSGQLLSYLEFELHIDGDENDDD